MSLTLSERPQKLRFPLITPVPIAHLFFSARSVQVMSCPWHHFKRTATAALTSGPNANSIPNDYCCNCVSTDFELVTKLPVTFSIFVKSHNQIFQFLWQFFSMWIHEADKQTIGPKLRRFWCLQVIL